jgi:hypothetical protein
LITPFNPPFQGSWHIPWLAVEAWRILIISKETSWALECGTLTKCPYCASNYEILHCVYVHNLKIKKCSQLLTTVNLGEHTSLLSWKVRFCQGN